MKWLIIPTLFFAFLSRSPIPIAIVAAIAAGLWVGKSWQIPPTADPSVRALQPYAPYAPALQMVVVFVMLGGSIIAVALLIVGVVAAVRYRNQLIGALEPWWQLQNSIPPVWRKPLAFVVPGLTGYYFGLRAGGQEWTYTLISVSVGIAIAFLLLFTPPDSMRRKIPA